MQRRELSSGSVQLADLRMLHDRRQWHQQRYSEQTSGPRGRSQVSC